MVLIDAGTVAFWTITRIPSKEIIYFSIFLYLIVPDMRSFCQRIIQLQLTYYILFITVLI